MAHNQGSFWGSGLIRPDKSASPLLEQLCLGLAKTIATTFEPTATDQLTPQKIAAYYRSVGGNYDGIFLQTPSASLSLIYRSLGCFHSLQPSSNAFESPSIPALLPNGFVRWQTMQLLLDPDEHVPFLQQALKRFDVMNPTTGAKFPKSIPRDAFPEKPDKELCQWHEKIGSRLEQDYNTRRIKAASPLYSPRGDKNSGHEAADSDYFPHSPHRGQPRKRPSYPSRSNSQDQRKTSHSSDRRGSLPDSGPSAWPSGGEHSVHFANSPRDSSTANRMSSSSAHSQSRHRNSNASSHSHHRPSSSSNGGHASIPPEEANLHPAHRHEHRPSDHRHRHRPSGASGPRLRPRSPITGTSSGSAASSEESIPPHTAHPALDRGRRRDSLFPPNALTNGVKRGLHHLRRHSHDATYRRTRDKETPESRPPLPPRPDIANMRQAYEKDRDRRRAYPPQPPPPQAAPPVPMNIAVQAPVRNGNQVKFHDRIFSPENNDDYGSGPTSAPESPGTRAPSSSKPRFKYTDSRGRDIRNNSPVRRSRSGSETDRMPDWHRQQRQPQGVPARVKTVSGVGGRKYASAEFAASPTSAEPVLERA
ncbi:MAG: hypothetical protein Q9227_000464 [Pyrenula ochraceoflavens]